MIDASETYKLIKEYASLEDQVFCDLHKCATPDSCSSKQYHVMLNFDKVKDIYCQTNGIESCKSADGLSYNDNGILFVIEIKGWELYERHGNPKTEEEVKDKVVNYKLSKKLSDSLMICKHVLSQTQSELVLPIVYLVVSDVKKEAKKEAVAELASALMILSETSSDFSSIYGDEIKLHISGISDVDCEFIADCRQIDSAIASWNKARLVTLL